jgi:hypothetical protein
MEIRNGMLKAEQNLDVVRMTLHAIALVGEVMRFNGDATPTGLTTLS